MQIFTHIKKHRSKSIIRLLYRYYPNNRTDKAVRELEDVKWSRTMSCWYIPYRDDYLSYLKKKLKITVLKANENVEIVKKIVDENKADRLARVEMYKSNKKLPEKIVDKTKQNDYDKKAVVIIDPNENKIILRLSDDEIIRNELSEIDYNYRLKNYSKWIFKGTNEIYLQIINILKKYNYKYLIEYIKSIDEQQENPIVRRFVQAMLIQNKSNHTINAYLPYFKEFVLNYEKKDISKLTYQEIDGYIKKQIRTKKIEIGQQKHLISAIKYYYEKIEGRYKIYFNLKNTNKFLNFNVNLSVSEITKNIKQINDKKETLLIFFFYYLKFNFSELAELTLDRSKNILHDIFKLQISQKSIILRWINIYYKHSNPITYFFEIKENEAYTKEQIQIEIIKISKKYNLTELYKKEFLQICEIAEMQENTTKNYLGYFLTFLKNFDFAHPLTVSNEQIRQFILKISKLKYSKNTVNQYINVIKLYYEKAHSRELQNYILRPKKGEQLPTILNNKELSSLFLSIKNIKHKSLMLITYAAGLRRNETLELRVKDIDFERNEIKVNKGKGNKDRITLLSENIKPVLKEYIKNDNPADYLFEGALGGKYSFTSFAKVLKNALKNTGILKDVTPHTLRHSFATHLLEQGVDIRYIQELLGHKDIKTTLRYVQVAKKELKKIKSPLDNLDFSGNKSKNEDKKEPP